MKFLFIIQGEGKGHLTQALTLEEMLIRNGHEVVEVLVGHGSERTLPGFFNRNIHAPVKRFISPSYVTTSNEGEQTRLRKKLTESLLGVPEYYKSMCYINDRIKKTGAEVVINFYELLTGLTYALFRPSVPYICIGHQYMFLHRDYEFPENHITKTMLLRLYTRLTSLRAKKRIALSLKGMSDDNDERIAVVPPLLRREILAISPEEGNYVNGMLTNDDLFQGVDESHKNYPNVPLRFFWNNFEAEEDTTVDDTLSYHLVNDVKFLNFIGKCKVYANNAGFESICEAMYLGKPLLMIPRHIEQRCHAHQAKKMGAGVVSDKIDLKQILDYSEQYHANSEFVHWVRSSERQIMYEVGRISNHNLYADMTNLSNCALG